ncbi:MAG: hypothetical protein E6234_00755 [Sutterella wadsworthensis]|nr:hypothetical protein [Sutterella wadsworthensis]
MNPDTLGVLLCLSRFLTPVALAAALAFGSVGTSAFAKNIELKFGVTPVPHAEIAEFIKLSPSSSRKGLT